MSFLTSSYTLPPVSIAAAGNREASLSTTCPLATYLVTLERFTKVDVYGF